MSKHILRQRAIKLRLKGMSYSQIRLLLGVGKSSLSLWLKDYPLTEERLRSLRDFSEVRIKKFQITMKSKREKRFADFYKEEKEKYLPLSKKELFIAGLFLYWGEGIKGLKYPLGIYNTNPQLVKFGLLWYKIALSVPVEKINVHLHLYSDMNIKEEIRFWSKELKVPASRFAKPYIKKTKKADINHKGTFGHGTCGLLVHNVLLKERVMAALKGIADYYENRI